MSRPIDKAWRSFSEQVVDPCTPDGERMDLRRAFFAGACALYSCIDITRGERPSIADGVNAMAAVHDELARFDADLDAGLA